MLPHLDSSVTTTQIIVAASAVVSSAAAVGSLVWGLSKTLTEFRLGIGNLTDTLKDLGKTMKDGFQNVDSRLDKGETKMESTEKRIIRLELLHNIDAQDH
jgi:hypothetical protein